MMVERNETWDEEVLALNQDQDHPLHDHDSPLLHDHSLRLPLSRARSRKKLNAMPRRNDKWDEEVFHLSLDLERALNDHEDQPLHDQNHRFNLSFARSRKKSFDKWDEEVLDLERTPSDHEDQPLHDQNHRFNLSIPRSRKKSFDKWDEEVFHLSNDLDQPLQDREDQPLHEDHDRDHPTPLSTSIKTKWLQICRIALLILSVRAIIILTSRCPLQITVNLSGYSSAFGGTSTAKGASSTTTTKQVHRPRLLLGIMSLDVPHEYEYRQQFRDLFGIYESHHSNRVFCSLGDFLTDESRTKEQHNDDCQIVYTFVLGANPQGPTELVNTSLPLLVPADKAEINATDKQSSDLTLLNIRENMEEGKSQTWLYRAQQLIREHNFTYVSKMDTDSVLDLPKMVHFVNKYLPPAPFNQAILAGKPCDKLWWGNWRTSVLDYPQQEQQAKEGYLRERYRFLPGHNTPFHIYAIGQFYLMSPDLVDTVIQQAQSQDHKTYMEGAEDHDISTMAFHSDKPIHFILLSKSDMQFWKHDVKLSPRRGEKRLRSKWRWTWKQTKADLIKTLSERPPSLGDS